MKTIRLAFASLAATAPCLMAFPFAAPVSVRADFGRVAAVADFNRDGRADVLMASTHDLVWMRHTTGTTFTQAATLSWPAATIDEVVARDIDGDGDMDVVLNTSSPSQLIILRNDGNFSFAKVLETPVGNAALDAGAIVGDYDNDGDLDAGMFHTVAGETVRRITWAANNAGTFMLQSPAQNAASLSWLKGLTADFNKDGFMDLAMGITDISVSRGTPSGVFTPWPSVTGTGLITHMEAGDVDGDGFPDLVFTSGTSNTTAQRAAWSRWNGSGFAAPSSIQNHTSGKVRGTHLMDLDEDGDLDTVYGDQAYYINASSQAPHQMLWAENSGGSLLLPKVLLDATEAENILSGDVDGDGDTDLVYSANGDVLLMQNTAIHRTAEFGSVVFTYPDHPAGGMCVADMDNNGEDDLVWSIPAENRITWGQGLSATHAFTMIQNLSNTAGPRVLAAGDLNHDGWVDLVFTADGAAQLQIASRTNGTWQFSNAAPLPAGTTELVVADVDRDGNNDIIIGHAAGITLLRSNGGFSPSWTSENVVSGIGPVTRICPVQLNGSGRMELMAMTVETSPVRCRIYRCLWVTGYGLWANVMLWEGDSGSSLLATGDANRDNGSDLFCAYAGIVNCAPSPLTGYTFGAFKPVNGLVTGLRCAETADFNNDGITDLVTAGVGTVMLSTGKGDGTFASPVPIFADPEKTFNRMVVLDIGHDGDMDVVVMTEGGDSVQRLYNECGHFDLTELPWGGKVLAAAPSTSHMAMHLTFTHNGRPGEAAVAIRNLRFRLVKASQSGPVLYPETGLTTAESTALLSSIEVYNDLGEAMNPEGPGTDTLVGNVGPATSIGYLTVTPSTPVNVNPGQTVRLWVRLKMAAGAGSSPIRSFYLQHITDPAAAGTMVAHAALTSNFRLDPMLIDEASTRVIVPGTLETWRFANWGLYDSTGIAANNTDADRDGVCNLMEYYTGTNPTVADRAANAAAALRVIAPNVQSLVKVQLITSSAALLDPRVRLRIEDGSIMPIWNNLIMGAGGVWTQGSPPSVQTSAGRSTLTFTPGFTPATKKRFFVHMLVEEQ